MVNFLKDVSLDTFLAELPSIINFNNNSLKNEFEILYDSSEGRLIKSVYVPNGTVQSHWGRFANLETDYIKVNNADSISQTVQNASIAHNLLSHRFRDDWIVNSSVDTFDYSYCHDPGVISSGVTTNSNILSLEDRLRAIESAVGISYVNSSTLAEDTYIKELTPAEEYANVLAKDASESYYSYDENIDLDYVTFVNAEDETDLRSNKYFNYYSAEGARYLKIDNSKPAFIYNDPKTSDGLTILFQNRSDSPYQIILSRRGLYSVANISCSESSNYESESGLVSLKLIRSGSDWQIMADSYKLPNTTWSISISTL